jgi:gluconokinase
MKDLTPLIPLIPSSSLRVVVMGVSGCGKSTVGRLLAEHLGARYVEGDDLHPPANVQRMAAGIALTDADRWGWLASVGEQLARGDARGEPSTAGAAPGVVASCSALKRRYRDQLRAAAPGLRFVYLWGQPELLAQRMQARQGHYMPATLLQSQLNTLEPPGEDEGAIWAEVSMAAEQIAAAAAAQLLVSRV